MTRPKVDPDKRQRTAQACDSCKRRKQKCNGLCPCNTCKKRNLSCSYGTSEHDSAEEPNFPIAKRRLTSSEDPDFEVSNPSGISPQQVTSSRLSPQSERRQALPQWDYAVEANGFGDAMKKRESLNPGVETPTIESAARSIGFFPNKNEGDVKLPLSSRGSTSSADPEEAVYNYTSSRMLQDPTGRLLYVGDSATLSYLQLVRMMVESAAGPSLFTTDPRRHRIMENTLSLPPNFRHTHLLPDKQTAHVLVDSFFVNTHGLLQVFCRKTFLNTLEKWYDVSIVIFISLAEIDGSDSYSDPLQADPSWLCLLHLVFAIGLLLATPLSASNDAIIINKLRSEPLDRAEIFYLNAKSLSDPMTGFEDAGFWSIQALFLMAVYMLIISKRNAAFAYFGMAVRSAFALGLHREETMVIFGSEEQDLRRNLWRSLFVLDRFLSASLGRPAAICEDECSGDTLTPPDVPSHPPPPVTFNQTSTLGLEASVRSCSVIGIILKKVYQQRKISANLAQEIADQCKIWPKALAPSLHWRQASSRNPSQGIAILHVNLFYCHSIVLLTRPFFLFLLNAEIQKQSTNPHERANRFGSRMEKFSEACVIASSHTIQLVQSAFEGGYLQRRNPFVIYFLFAATLIVLSNEFSRLYANDSANQCINDVISVFAYCAESDPQAARLLFIMTAFRGAISSHVERSKARLNSHRNDPISKIRAPSNEAPQPYDAGATSFPSIETPSAPPDLPTPRNGSFSGLLDVNVLHNPVTGLSEESSAVDEQIDFDAFWNWPTTTPTAGIQSISDSTVPLFGMSDMS